MLSGRDERRPENDINTNQHLGEAYEVSNKYIDSIISRRSTDDTENKVTEKDKQSETPIMSPRKVIESDCRPRRPLQSSKPPALPSLQPETHQRQVRAVIKMLVKEF